MPQLGAAATVRSFEARRRRARGKTVGSQLYTMYVIFFVAVIYGAPFIASLDKLQGQLNGQTTATVMGIVIALTCGLALSNGMAGGPISVSRPDVMLIAPAPGGVALLSRSVRRIVLYGGVAGAVLGAAITYVARTDTPAGTLLAAGVVGAQIGLLAAALAVVTPTLTRRAQLGLLSAVALTYVVPALTHVVPPTAYRLASGHDLEIGRALFDLGSTLLVVAFALSRIDLQPLAGLARRADATGLYSVALGGRDLRSLIVLRQSFSGESARSGARPRVGRSFFRVRRHLLALSRSPLRRWWRLALLTLVGGLGWYWAAQSGSAALAVIPVASWLLGVELTEPIGSDGDRPFLLEQLPVSPFRHLLDQELAACVTVALVLGVQLLGLFLLLGERSLRVGLPLFPAMVVSTVAAGTITNVRGAAQFSLFSSQAPEMSLPSVLFRELVPMAVIVLALLPLRTVGGWAGDSSASVRTLTNSLSVAAMAAVITAFWYGPGIASFRAAMSGQPGR